MDTIHSRIHRRRKELGLSMEAVATACGYKSWQTVQQWEKGDTAPKRNVIKRLAQVLQCAPEYLLFMERDSIHGTLKYSDNLQLSHNSETLNNSANLAGQPSILDFPQALIARFLHLSPANRAKVIERMVEYITYLESQSADEPQSAQKQTAGAWRRLARIYQFPAKTLAP